MSSHARLSEEFPDGFKILIIDDSTEDRETYKRFLTQRAERFVFYEAENCDLGSQICHDQHPDCVLLDYNLPGTDGIEFIEEGREHPGEPLPPVIMLTGQGDEDVAVHALKAGASDYISKAALNPDNLVKTVFHSIEKRKLQEKIRLYRHNLEKSNGELSSFAHTVAHDLKSPLRKIGMFCEMLAEDEGNTLSEESRHSLERIIVNSHRMQTLVQDLLNYALIGTTEEKIQDNRLNDIVSEAVEAMRDVLDEHNAQIDISPLPVVRGCPVKLKQVFINLLSNSLKYRRQGISPVINISADTEQGKNGVLLRIADNGQGIPADKAAYIFEPFKRLHSADQVEGSGLGLSIVHKIVRDLNGDIWVEAQDSPGALFVIRLPIV